MRYSEIFSFVNNRLLGFFLIVMFLLGFMYKLYYSEAESKRANIKSSLSLEIANKLKKESVNNNKRMLNSAFTYNDFLIFAWYSRRNEAGELYFADVPDGVIKSFCTIKIKKDTTVVKRGDTIKKETIKEELTSFGSYLLRINKK